MRYLCATLILLLRIMSANCRYPPLARFFFRQLSRMVCGVVVRLLRYASASRLCQLSGMLCRLFCSVAYLPPFPFWGWLCGIPYRLFSSLITSGLYPDIGFAVPPIVTCHGVLCARFLWARITLFLFVVHSSVILSEIHHPPYLSMTERWPSDERAMTERKNADFLTQNEQKLHIYAPNLQKICENEKFIVPLRHE